MPDYDNAQYLVLTKADAQQQAVTSGSKAPDQITQKGEQPISKVAVDAGLSREP